MGGEQRNCQALCRHNPSFRKCGASRVTEGKTAGDKDKKIFMVRGLRNVRNVWPEERERDDP
jgi:hypothetical protein